MISNHPSLINHSSLLMMNKSFIIVDDYIGGKCLTRPQQQRIVAGYPEMKYLGVLKLPTPPETTTSIGPTEIASQLTPEYDNHNLTGKEDNTSHILSSGNAMELIRL